MLRPKSRAGQIGLFKVLRYCVEIGIKPTPKHNHVRLNVDQHIAAEVVEVDFSP